MTRKPAPAAPREMPPMPASGGCWRFDPETWAYVPDAAPTLPPAPDTPAEEKPE